MSKSQGQPSPALFFETVNAFHRTACIKTAVELDLFTAIAEGNTTAAALAERSKASSRGIEALCDGLVTIGFLTKSGEEWGLTLDSSVFLDRSKPGYVGKALEFLLSPTLTFGWETLTDAVRHGGSVVGESGTISPEHPVWETFARAMGGLTVPSRKFIAGLAQNGTSPNRILDIAAGHGMYGIELAERDPSCKVVALDWPRVLKVAKENARQHGVIDRWETIEGNAFEEELRGPHDLVLLTNFLHHFDRPQCESFLRKVHQALDEGGRAITLEFVPNEDRVSPPGQAMFNLIMLATTPRGRAYSFGELDGMFQSAGFSRSELHDVPGMDQRVVVSWR
jgi:SAM-dependent methyltransferase